MECNGRDLKEINKQPKTIRSLNNRVHSRILIGIATIQTPRLSALMGQHQNQLCRQL